MGISGPDWPQIGQILGVFQIRMQYIFGSGSQPFSRLSDTYFSDPIKLELVFLAGIRYIHTHTISVDLIYRLGLSARFPKCTIFGAFHHPTVDSGK